MSCRIYLKGSFFLRILYFSKFCKTQQHWSHNLFYSLVKKDISFPYSSLHYLMEWCCFQVKYIKYLYICFVLHLDFKGIKCQMVHKLLYKFLQNTFDLIIACTLPVFTNNSFWPKKIFLASDTGPGVVFESASVIQFVCKFMLVSVNWSILVDFPSTLSG